jgi:hypothetical protein
VRPAPLGLHLLLGPDAATVRSVMLRNFDEWRISVVYGVLDRD